MSGNNSLDAMSVSPALADDRAEVLGRLAVALLADGTGERVERLLQQGVDLAEVFSSALSLARRSSLDVAACGLDGTTVACMTADSTATVQDFRETVAREVGHAAMAVVLVTPDGGHLDDDRLALFEVAARWCGNPEEPLMLTYVQMPQTVWACVQRPTAHNAQLIFFYSSAKGPKWLLWDFSPDTIASGPNDLASGWFRPLPAPFNAGFDTCCNDPLHPTGVNRGHLLFFKDAHVLRWDFTPDAPLGVRPIAEEFPGLPEPFASGGVDAAVRRPTQGDELILFKGDQWVSYNKRTNYVAEPVSALRDRWFAALPEPFASKIDAVVRRPTAETKELIFFSGGQWLLWDFSPDTLIDGPNLLTAGWFRRFGRAMAASGR